MKTRLTVLDNMQGVAMLLVVIGHSAFNGISPAWCFKVKDLLYSFHMALFVFISGFLIRYNYREITSLIQYREFILKRLKKFGIPFLTVGTICLVLTAWERHFGASEFAEGFFYLILAPRQSHSGFLWYIYLLFEFYCLVPLLYKLKGWWQLALLVCLAYPAMHPLPFQWGACDHASRFLFFLYAGSLAANIFLSEHGKFSFYLLLPIAVAALGFVALEVYFWINGIELYSFFAGVLSIPFIFGLSLLLMKCSCCTEVLGVISRNCFYIYLLHLFVLQFISKCFLLAEPYIRLPFEVYILIAIPAALTVPVLFQRWRKKWQTISD